MLATIKLLLFFYTLAWYPHLQYCISILVNDQITDFPSHSCTFGSRLTEPLVANVSVITSGDISDGCRLPADVVLRGRVIILASTSANQWSPKCSPSLDAGYVGFSRIVHREGAVGVIYASKEEVRFPIVVSFLSFFFLYSLHNV